MGSVATISAGAISVVIMHHDATSASGALPWPQAVIQLVFGGVGAIVFAFMVWHLRDVERWMASLLLAIAIALIVMTVIRLCQDQTENSTTHDSPVPTSTAIQPSQSKQSVSEETEAP